MHQNIARPGNVNKSARRLELHEKSDPNTPSRRNDKPNLRAFILWQDSAAGMHENAARPEVVDKSAKFKTTNQGSMQFRTITDQLLCHFLFKLGILKKSSTQIFQSEGKKRKELTKALHVQNASIIQRSKAEYSKFKSEEHHKRCLAQGNTGSCKICSTATGGLLRRNSAEYQFRKLQNRQKQTPQGAKDKRCKSKQNERTDNTDSQE